MVFSSFHGLGPLGKLGAGKGRTGQKARSHVLSPTHHLLSFALLLLTEHGRRQALLSLPKDGKEIYCWFNVTAVGKWHLRNTVWCT